MREELADWMGIIWFLLMVILVAGTGVVVTVLDLILMALR